MKEFNYSKLKDQKWDSEILGYIAAIYKEVGKQDMYLKTKPKELEKLVEIAKIQSTESSNAIEGIVTTSTRIKLLMNEKTTPKNRDEKEIVGYRDALNVIHENFDNINITKNYILQLHKIMCKYSNNTMGGKLKNVQNYITINNSDVHSDILFTPISPIETPQALDDICCEYNKVVGNGEVEPLIMIPIFIHDFLCIHPFNDGNGRMSRLLTTLLLYQSGFYIGKYISLENKIAQNKNMYYETLREAQDGWHDNKEDVTSFIKYILSTILEAYRDFEERYEIVEGKSSALDKVKKAIEGKIGKFTKQQIIELCPSLSISSVEGALRSLIESGDIKREGQGRSTYYMRLK